MAIVEARPTPVTRRHLMNLLAGVPVAAALSGCASLLEIFDNIPDTCPRSPSDNGDVNWIPDIGHPVWSTSVDVSAVRGSHRAMSIYYPTFRPQPVASPFEGALSGNPLFQQPILKLCLTRFPLVLFLHGNGPGPVGLAYKKWRRLPSTLARAGYVVVVPSHSGANFFGPNDIQDALRDLAWVRNQWAQSRWVSPRPEFAVAGHSNGALQAFYLARNIKSVVALAALSGQFTAYPDLVDQFPNVNLPTLFMWARGKFAEDLSGGYANALDIPKFQVSFAGEHFDYLEPEDTGTWPRGPCNKMPAMAADIVALFVARHFRSYTHVHPYLLPPRPSLNAAQQTYANDYLQSSSEIMCMRECSVEIEWNVGPGDFLEEGTHQYVRAGDNQIC